jgi:hypothetical protein
MKNQFLTLCAASAILVGSSTAQTETHKYVASNAGMAEAFGHSVVIDGKYAVISARNAVVNGVDTGAVYVYDRTMGMELYILQPADGGSGDKFGFDLAIEGDTLLVGSPHHDVMGMNMVGSVYVYDLTTGLETGRLVPNTMQMMGHFGIGVDIDNGIAAIGAYTRDPIQNGVDSGEAFLFDVATSTQLHSLIASDGAPGDMMGWSVSISGNSVIASADLHADHGAVYVFDVTTGAQTHKFEPMDVGVGDRFGWMVDLEGNNAIISSHKHDRASTGDMDTGAVYLFHLGMNMQMGKFTAVDSDANDEFGYSVSFDGGRVAIGAPFDDDATMNAGSVYVFDFATQMQEYKILASDAAMSDLYGSSIDVSGAALLVGSIYDDDVIMNAGSAYEYDLAPPCWSKFCTVADGSTLNTATLDPSGCDLSGPINMMMMGGPMNQFTYLLIGSGSSIIDGSLFGASGNLCLAGGTIGRYTKDAGMTNMMGMFVTEISSTSTGGPNFGIPNSGGATILAGQTWHFQYWHRNMGGMPSGFSEAVSIIFQ